jgi:hypothetical protein
VVGLTKQNEVDGNQKEIKTDDPSAQYPQYCWFRGLFPGLRGASDNPSSPSNLCDPCSRSSHDAEFHSIGLGVLHRFAYYTTCVI